MEEAGFVYYKTPMSVKGKHVGIIRLLTKMFYAVLIYTHVSSNSFSQFSIPEISCKKCELQQHLDRCLLGNDTMKSSRWFPVFQRKIYIFHGKWIKWKIPGQSSANKTPLLFKGTSCFHLQVLVFLSRRWKQHSS